MSPGPSMMVVINNAIFKNKFILNNMKKKCEGMIDSKGGQRIVNAVVGL